MVYRPCVLKMPAVLQIALIRVFTCVVGVHFVSNCVSLPDLGVLKSALLKIILGVVWCAIALAGLKRQGLDLLGL